MERIPIVLADDHLLVRTQVLARLNREPDLQVVGLADTSTSAISCARDAHPRVVLIDPMMSDGMGLEAIRRIRLELPQVAIVVLTAFTDTAQKIELQKMGVRYILNKGIESFKLVNLLHQAAGYSNGKLD
jgi:DNA-binding NarL/FixJ family response regulator